MRFWIGLGSALLLASCGREEPRAESSASAETIAPETAPGIAVSDARIQLPVVSGRPGAAYFTIARTSGAPRRLVGVTIEMAGRSEMHDSAGGAMAPVKEVALEPGETVKFEPGGKHVMLFDLDPKLRFSKDVLLTILLDDGDTAGARAAVTTVNEAMEMDH